MGNKYSHQPKPEKEVAKKPPSNIQIGQFDYVASLPENPDKIPPGGFRPTPLQIAIGCDICEEPIEATEVKYVQHDSLSLS